MFSLVNRELLFETIIILNDFQVILVRVFSADKRNNSSLAYLKAKFPMGSYSIMMFSLKAL